ncbi:MAG: aminopeptidase P family protein [Candidatus Latescibacteria bacterium]|nr:aminopeptidase P family protein [Candidatus Latescibacterota bacterium]
MKLTTEGCRARQKRMVEVLAEQKLDGAIISRREHVYYFTGFLHGRFNGAAVYIGADGRTALVGAGVPAEVAADQLIQYEGGYHATMHSRQFEAVAEKLVPVLPKGARLGADLGGGIACLAALGGAGVADLTRQVYRLRKRKLPDEVDAIRAAIRIAEVMYAAAKESLHPGADEVEILAHLRAEGTKAAGEDLEYFGNDFRANALGGAARRRRMEAGELYILDAGPALHGYFADNCRTFAVDRSPTAAQLKAWEHIDSLFPRIEAAVKPGLKAVEVFNLADEYFKGKGYQGMVHHLGHGLGLGPHETPELNPNYDATFEVGDVFTMEPGVYTGELKAGIRLEENYLITEEGLEKLTTFPRRLV